MAAELGSLLVRLGLDAGDFTAGLSKQEQAARRFAQQLDRTIAAGVIKAQLALEAMGAAARTAVEAFQVLTTGAADFQDLAETTGATAESLASLAVSAATAGVEMSNVGSAINMLTKNLVGVDDESKAAGAALAAIGLNVREFKQLDPASQYEAVGKALAGFADGAEKVAVAQALFGRQGTEQLKVFAALQEAGGRQKILTDDQIRAADAYADAQAKATAEIRLYAQAAATQVLPALTSLSSELANVTKEVVGVDRATGQLTANNAIRDFAFDIATAIAVAIEALTGLAKAVRAIGGSFESVGADLSFIKTLATAGPAEIAQALRSGTGPVADALAARNKTVAEANQRYVDLWNYDGDRISRAIAEARRKAELGLTGFRNDAFSDPRSTLFGQKPADALPKIDTSRLRGGGGGGRIGGGARDQAAVQTEAERYLENLQRQLERTKDLTVAEQVLADIQSGRLKLAGNVTQEQLLGVAQQIDAARAMSEEMERQQRRNEELAAAQQRVAEEGRRVFEAMRTPAEDLAAEIDRLNRLLQAGAIDWETYSRAQFAAQDAFDRSQQATKSAAEELDSFAKNAAENIQGALGDELTNIMQGNFDDIGKSFARMLQRMAAEALAADIARNLFGSGAKGGSGGGWVGAAASWLGSFFGGGKAIGGPTMPNTLYEVGERRPEVYDDGSRQYLLTGSKRGRIDPNPSFDGGRAQTNYFHITVPGGTDRRTAGQFGAEAARQLQMAAARNA